MVTKGKRHDLKAAYVQLMAYKDDLGNPPLLVVSDIGRIEIGTTACPGTFLNTRSHRDR